MDVAAQRVLEKLVREVLSDSAPANSLPTVQSPGSDDSVQHTYYTLLEVPTSHPAASLRSHDSVRTHSCFPFAQFASSGVRPLGPRSSHVPQSATPLTALCAPSSHSEACEIEAILRSIVESLADDPWNNGTTMPAQSRCAESSSFTAPSLAHPPSSVSAGVDDNAAAPLRLDRGAFGALPRPNSSFGPGGPPTANTQPPALGSVPRPAQRTPIMSTRRSQVATVVPGVEEKKTRLFAIVEQVSVIASAGAHEWLTPAAAHGVR